MRGVGGGTPLIWIRSPTPSPPSRGDLAHMRTPGSASVLLPVARGGSRTPRRAGEGREEAGKASCRPPTSTKQVLGGDDGVQRLNRWEFFFPRQTHPGYSP